VTFHSRALVHAFLRPPDQLFQLLIRRRFAYIACSAYPGLCNRRTISLPGNLDLHSHLVLRSRYSPRIYLCIGSHTRNTADIEHLELLQSDYFFDRSDCRALNNPESFVSFHQYRALLVQPQESDSLAGRVAIRLLLKTVNLPNQREKLRAIRDILLLRG